MPLIKPSKRVLARLVRSMSSKFGYRLVKQSDFIPQRNFHNLLVGYEQMLNDSFATEHPITENSLRVQLMARLAGTPPTEAYFIIKGLAETAHIDGDVCEFGVAQGETSALIANEIISTTKTLHLFDSFEGLPQPTSKDELKDDIFALGSIEAYAGTMSVPMDFVLARLKAVEFPASRYVIHKGFFETLVATKENFPTSVSFAYVDFDFYEPIKLVLDYLDTVICAGGQIIVDDYNYFSTGAKAAVDEFLIEKNTSSVRYAFFVPNSRYGYFAILTRLT